MMTGLPFNLGLSLISTAAKASHVDMDDFSRQIINQWKYEHLASFLAVFSFSLYRFSEKMEKSSPNFQNIIQIISKKQPVL